jgi:CRISPR-associated Csh1 family protein
MIKSLYQLGVAYCDDPIFADYFKPFQSPFSKEDDQLVVRVDVVQGKVQDISLASFRRSKLSDYLFRKPAGSNGTYLTPTSLYYHSDKPEERADNLAKFYGKLERTIAGNKKLYEQYFDLTTFWESFKSRFEENVIGKIRPGNVLVTFYFDGHAPGQIPEFRDLLFSEAYDKYQKSKKATFVGKNHVCAVTHQLSEEVWGKIDTLGFTVDDEAFIRGGFEISESWKMFPVAKEVIPILEGAKNMALDRFSFNFFKLKYIIIPRFVGWEREDIRLAMWNMLSKTKEELNLLGQGKAIIGTENSIQELAGTEPFKRPGATFDYLFFQQNQAQFSVKLHLVDVMPSRMREISEVAERVKDCYRLLIDKEIMVKKEKMTIQYLLTFANLKDYFSELVNKELVFHPIFFRIMEAVFYRQQIPEELVLKAFQEKLVSAFKNIEKESYAFLNHGYQTLAFYEYLAQLGMFKFKPTPIMEKQIVALELDSFIAQHENGFLREPERKAAFLAGCLVERLLMVQRLKNKSEPFRRHLNNLYLSPEQLFKIMVLWENKVQEYVSAGNIHPANESKWTDLKAQVFSGLAQAGQSASRNKNAFSYAFTMGMVMEKAFAKEAKRLRDLQRQITETEQAG